MKFSQKKPQYTPITITLETEEEAKAFLSLIDKIDWKYSHANPPPEVTREEYEIVKTISDAFTNFEVFINSQT